MTSGREKTQVAAFAVEASSRDLAVTRLVQVPGEQAREIRSLLREHLQAREPWKRLPAMRAEQAGSQATCSSIPFEADDDWAHFP